MSSRTREGYLDIEYDGMFGKKLEKRYAKTSNKLFVISKDSSSKVLKRLALVPETVKDWVEYPNGFTFTTTKGEVWNCNCEGGFEKKQWIDALNYNRTAGVDKAGNTTANMPPVPPLATDVKVIATTPAGFANWFHGFITRADAEGLLKAQKSNTFLIRSAESRPGYSLSLIFEGNLKHFMIAAVKGNRWTVVGNERTYPNLNEIVTYHKIYPLTDDGDKLEYPCPSDKPIDEKCFDPAAIFKAVDESKVDFGWQASYGKLISTEKGASMRETANNKAVELMLTLERKRLLKKFGWKENYDASCGPAPDLAHLAASAVQLPRPLSMKVDGILGKIKAMMLERERLKVQYGWKASYGMMTSSTMGATKRLEAYQRADKTLIKIFG